MAIHTLVHKTDITVKDWLTSLGVFLNTEVVFDMIIFESMCKAAEEYGVERGVLRWISTMLTWCAYHSVLDRNFLDFSL
jgi:hypothetical protein